MNAIPLTFHKFYIENMLNAQMVKISPGKGHVMKRILSYFSISQGLK